MKPAGSFPILTNKDSMRKPGVLTKGNPKCSCSFCEIGQLNGVQHILFNKEIRDKPGRPATATKENDLSGLLAIYKQTMRLTLLQEARKLMHQSSKTL